MKEYTLNNGIKVPALAFGTWLIKDKDAARCVKMALDAGYRHIDTAQAYGNERGVGEGIRLSGLKREEVFITSKVKAETKTYRGAKRSIDNSLKRLGVDYIDLMLIHCPQPWALFRSPIRFFKENINVWRALEEAYKEGKLKAIGISNFFNDDTENILKNCEIKPMVNQIPVHICHTPLDVMRYSKEHDITVEAYSPIAHGRILNNKEIKEIADKYNVSVPQLCIKYTLQLNTISIPKASSKEHIEDNIKLDFEISKEDMINLLKMNDSDYGEDPLWPLNN